MKSLSLVLLAIALTTPGWAGPKEELAANNKNRRDTFELFKAGRGDEAETQFSASLVSARQGHARSVQIAVGLLDVSAQLYNVRQIGPARDAASRAIAICNRLSKHQELGADLAALYARIGFIQE